jgi:hypothetical protein
VVHDIKIENEEIVVMKSRMFPLEVRRLLLELESLLCKPKKNFIGIFDIFVVFSDLSILNEFCLNCRPF